MAENFTAGLRKAVMNMIVKHGAAYNPEINTWGDTRGRREFAAEKHMPTCTPKKMTGYTEEYNWYISDTMNNDAHVGIRAFITCECGEVENIAFIISEAGLGTILGWLLEDENEGEN